MSDKKGNKKDRIKRHALKSTIYNCAHSKVPRTENRAEHQLIEQVYHSKKDT
jgi:hypothetical protein